MFPPLRNRLLALCLTSCFVPAQAMAADLAKAAAGVRQIIAHRGSSADRPENTLASTRRAMEAGATAVEVDVRTTKDGHLVILHDATRVRQAGARLHLNGRTGQPDEIRPLLQHRPASLSSDDPERLIRTFAIPAGEW